MLANRWFKIWQNWTVKNDRPAEAIQRELEYNRDALATAEEALAQRDLELTEVQGQLDWERYRYQELFDLAPQAYLETDESGVIQAVNQAAATLLQKRVEFLRGIPLVLFVASSARDHFYRVLSELNRRGSETREYELDMQQLAGRPFAVTIAARAVRNEEGKISLYWILNDVTARKRVEKALRAAHESLLHHVKRQTAELAVVKATMTEELEVRQRVEEQAMTASRMLNQTVEERTAELAETHATLAQEVAERERMEREMVQRNRELAALNRVSSALSGSLELPTVMRILKASAVDVLEVDGGLIYLYEKSQQRFRLYDSWGTGKNFESQLQYLNAPGLAAEAIMQEKAMIFPELAQLVTGGPEGRDYLFLPLVAQKEMQGGDLSLSQRAGRL
jgi:PAS domain S-box-containing protein